MEVYFDAGDVGWLSFDPTPPDLSSKKKKRSALLGFLNHYLDFMRLKWKSTVIDYDIKKQKKVATKTFKTIKKIQNDLSELIDSLKDIDVPATGGRYFLYGAAIFLGLFMILLLLGVLILRFKGIKLSTFLQRYLRVERSSPTVEFYMELLNALIKKGFVRKESKTPLEFANSVVEKGGAHFEDVFGITDSYYRVRFGHQQLSDDELKDIKEKIQKIKDIDTRKERD